MANVYVRSGAGGAATGADWANAYLTLAAALTAKAAGDSFWVSEDHAETQASAMTLTSPGTAASPCFIYCVDHAGSVPPVSADLRTTATISTTGANALNLNAGGVGYYRGITFSAASGSSNGGIAICQGGAATAIAVLENCALVLNTTSSSPGISMGATAQANAVKLINTTMQFGATAQAIGLLNCRLEWLNTASALLGTIPTTLFNTASRAASALIHGVDLSAAGAGKTIFGAVGSASQFTMSNCKLGASVTIAATPSSQAGGEVVVARADSAGTNYIEQKYTYAGTQTDETTIVRTGGATDGTTPKSRKIVTTANSKWLLPFECIPITIWNDTTGSAIQITIYGTTTGGGVPKDDEIWFDAEFLGSASFPTGSFQSTTKADNLAASAATNNSADASTWAGGGAGNGFKIVSPTFTPQQKGPITIYLKAAKASTTYYVDPKPAMNGVTVMRSEIIAPGVYVNEVNSSPIGKLISAQRGTPY